MNTLKTMAAKLSTLAPEDVAPISLNGVAPETVNSFEDPDSLITNSDQGANKIESHISGATVTFSRLQAETSPST